MDNACDTVRACSNWLTTASKNTDNNNLAVAYVQLAENLNRSVNTIQEQYIRAISESARAFGSAIIQHNDKTAANLRSDVSSLVGCVATDVAEQLEASTSDVNRRIDDLAEMVAELNSRTETSLGLIGRLNDYMADQLNESFWKSYGTRYAGKKITKQVMFELIRDLKEHIGLFHKY